MTELSDQVTEILAPTRTLAAMTDTKIAEAITGGDLGVAVTLHRVAHPGTHDLSAMAAFWGSPLGQALRRLYLGHLDELPKSGLPAMTINEAAHVLGITKSTTSTMRRRGLLLPAEDGGGIDAASVWAETARLTAKRGPTARRRA